MKRPKLLRDLVGMKVRATRDFKNGFMRIPAGTIMTVRDNSISWNKLALEGEACPHCGVRPHINKVPINDLELVG